MHVCQEKSKNFHFHPSRMHRADALHLQYQRQYLMMIAGRQARFLKTRLDEIWREQLWHGYF